MCYRKDTKQNVRFSLEDKKKQESPTPASFFVYWSRTQSGKNIMKQIPAPPSLSADIVPPIDSTIVFTIDSPKPAPPISRERDLSTR